MKAAVSTSKAIYRRVRVVRCEAPPPLRSFLLAGNSEVGEGRKSFTGGACSFFRDPGTVSCVQRRQLRARLQARIKVALPPRISVHEIKSMRIEREEGNG